jgi:hypothetical protein
MDRLRLGLLLLALAPVAWIVGLLTEDGSSYIPALLVMLVGLAMAWWMVRGERAWVAAGGFLVAAIGVLWFYEGALFTGLASIAGSVVILGCLVAGFGAIRGMLGILSVGLLIVALGSLLWVYADGVGGGWIWQPGNLLAAVGAGLAGWAAWSEAPAPA